MKTVSLSLQVFLYIVLASQLRSTTGASSPGFVIKNNGLCIQVLPPVTIKGVKCPKKITSLFQWRFLKDGEIQNIGTGMCVDSEQVNNVLMKLKMSKCFYRKSLQKFLCDKYLVYPAHSKLNLLWKFLKDGSGTMHLMSKDTSLNKIELQGSSADICDLGFRDNCLQTVGKIPTPKGTCFVFLSKKDVRSYLLVPVAGKPSLEQFTVSLWIKAPPQTNAGIFHYMQDNRMKFGLIGNAEKDNIQFYLFSTLLKVTKPTTLILTASNSGVWLHLAFTWSNITNKLQTYINGNHISTMSTEKIPPLPGIGTLTLASLERSEDKLSFAGYMTEFNIYSRPFTANEVALLAARLHCCDLIQGDWLSWREILQSGKMFGKTKRSDGAECSSFEELAEDWNEIETARWACERPLFLAYKHYIPNYRFTSSSNAPLAQAYYGRAFENSSRPWCPSSKDHNSYLQVDLGVVKKLTAFATGKLESYKDKHVEMLKFYYSFDGLIWKTDHMIYNVAFDEVLPAIKVVHLKSAVTARYVRFYPTGSPYKMCVTVEIYGCEPEIEKRIFQGEDGCTAPNKPYLFMDFGEFHELRRIQVVAHRGNPKSRIRSFYIYYMSWKHWVPYHVDKKLKIFKGSGEVNRPFTHVLPLPIITRFLKIFPARYAEQNCAEFTFIGCPPHRKDYCENCNRTGVKRCALGYIGNYKLCEDFDECVATDSKYCDKNSYCKNMKGSFDCTPCKNGFIGDGKICQTACEALGIFCGPNSFCDISECKCDEGFINNGTDCVEVVENEKTTAATVEENHLAGSCPDGYFNCFGDVIFAIRAFKRAGTFYQDYDISECNEIVPAD